MALATVLFLTDIAARRLGSCSFKERCLAWIFTVVSFGCLDQELIQTSHARKVLRERPGTEGVGLLPFLTSTHCPSHEMSYKGDGGEANRWVEGRGLSI